MCRPKQGGTTELRQARGSGGLPVCKVHSEHRQPLTPTRRETNNMREQFQDTINWIANLDPTDKIGWVVTIVAFVILGIYGIKQSERQR